MSTIEQWWAEGETLSLDAGGGRHAIFLRREGSGPFLTALHGFPSSSYDWARVAPALARERTLLMPDLLGYGASAKPREHAYELLEQADLVEALWRAQGVRRTALLAHDYSVSIAQELLARRAEGALDVALDRVVLLNGGLFPDLHRPEPAQLALLDPVQGPRLAAAIEETLFTAGLVPTFAAGFDAAADSLAMWRALGREDGQRVVHLLIRYIPERERHAERWTAALAHADVPLTFVWGMLDPVSGAHMAAGIAERVPGGSVIELPDVAHWPQLEAPARVAAAVLASEG